MTELFQSLRARDATGVVITLITIDHASLTSPIRVSADPTEVIVDHPRTYGTISRGMTFTHLPVMPMFPATEPGTPPTAGIKIQNVDLEILRTLEALDLSSEAARVAFEAVHSTDLDTVGLAFRNFLLMGWSHDDQWISLPLAFDARTNDSYPAGRFTRQSFPAVHSE